MRARTGDCGTSGCGTAYLDAWIGRPAAVSTARAASSPSCATQPCSRCVSAPIPLAAGAALVKARIELPRIGRPDGGVHFRLPTVDMTGSWNAGFRVDDLVDLIVPADGQTGDYYVTAEWASRWPSVEIWTDTKTGPAV